MFSQKYYHVWLNILLFKLGYSILCSNAKLKSLNVFGKDSRVEEFICLNASQ